MFLRIRHRQFLLAIVLLTAALGFAGQQSGSPQSATLQNQPAAQASRSKAQSEAQSEVATGTAASSSHHRIHFHLGPVLVDGGYSYFSGPAFLPLAYSYGYPLWGYYGYSPYWAFWPSVFDGFGDGYLPYTASLAAGYDKGEVKLRVTPKTADLFIDDAYAGSVARLKGSAWLSPGVYNICLKASGHADVCRRIYVLSGKTIDIVANLGLGGVKP